MLDNKTYLCETEKIIELGIENYKNKCKNLDLEDYLYINKIYDSLDDIIK